MIKTISHWENFGCYHYVIKMKSHSLNCLCAGIVIKIVFGKHILMCVCVYRWWKEAWGWLHSAISRRADAVRREQTGPVETVAPGHSQGKGTYCTTLYCSVTLKQLTSVSKLRTYLLLEESVFCRYVLGFVGWTQKWLFSDLKVELRRLHENCIRNAWAWHCRITNIP